MIEMDWLNGIPPAVTSEYRLTVAWRADADGEGIRCYLHIDGSPLQASFHPTLNILEAIINALDNFFARDES